MQLQLLLLSRLSMAALYISLTIFNLLVCAVLFLSHQNKLCVYGAEVVANDRHAAEIKSPVPASARSITTNKGPVQQFQGLRIPHRYGQSSPFELERSVANSRKILSRQEFRTHGLEANTYVDINNYGEGIKLTLERADDNFVVRIGLGTPKSDFLLLFDTGSDVTWVPCQGSNAQNSNFDPSSSSTFSRARCDIPPCGYNITYADGSYSVGYFANDTLTISPTEVYQNFIFGCAQNIGGYFGGAIGVLGMGPGDYSLLPQTEDNYLNVFCYCLPATESSTGYLVFGVQAFETCQPDTNKMIEIIGSPNQNQYFVNLIGITIGQRRLGISSNVSSSLKTIVDSGTTITRLPAMFYSELKFAFRELMSGYPLVSPSGILDTCYDLEGYNNWTPPTMVLHFADSIDVDLDQSAVTKREINSHKVCLAFAESRNADDLIIIGNQQQLELPIFYALSTGPQKLAFGTGGCTN